MCELTLLCVREIQITNEHYAYILVILYFCSEFWIGFSKRVGTKATMADQGSLYLLGGTVVVSMALSFFLARRLEFADLAFLRNFYGIGVGVFCVGILLRWYAIIHLGQFFTVNVAIADDHRVVDTGPYKYVRHPSYTGGLLMFLGLGLCLANWVSLAVLLIPSTGAYLWRINIEERALQAALKEAYVTYSRKTRRLLPYVY